MEGQACLFTLIPPGRSLVRTLRVSVVEPAPAPPVDQGGQLAVLEDEAGNGVLAQLQQHLAGGRQQQGADKQRRR